MTKHKSDVKLSPTSERGNQTVLENTSASQIVSLDNQGKEKEIPLDWFSISGNANDEGLVEHIKKITVDHFKFSQFLMKLGFYRFDKDGESFVVHTKNRIVKVCSQTDVVDAVEDHIKNIPGELVSNGNKKIKKERLLGKLYAGTSTYFSDNLLKRCRKESGFSFLEDTKEKSYFFFKNCIVEVSGKKINPLSYDSVKDKYIWKDQILDRDFEELLLKDFLDGPFSKFVSNISCINDDSQESLFDPQRHESLMTIIGYNLHKYYEGKLKATILTDSTVSDNPNGRTGKTLLAKAIGKMLNTDVQAKTYVELNGKNFKFIDPKRYQECELDTKLVHLNDVVKNFQFELLFNDISEGIKAVQHYKAPFLVNAKIIISTNRTIKVRGDSAKDRCMEFELSNHYGLNRSPEKEFGHWFFRDWNKKQWLQFDNFLIYCVKLYLRSGLIEPKAINLNTRKLYEETAKEFVVFMEDHLLKNTGEWLDKKELFESFKEQFSDFNRKGNRSLLQRTFTDWCRLYSEYKDEIIDCEEKRSNNKFFIRFINEDDENY